MPVSNITNCTFGGRDLKTLYITSASMSAPVGERLAGGLFAIDANVRGLPTDQFRISSDAISKLTTKTQYPET